MNRRSIEIGDKVRFIMSYYDMVKSDYLFPELFKQPDPQDSDIMLGGVYTVKDVKQNQWGILMFKLLVPDSDQSWAPEALVWPTSQIQSCPFTAGDELLFRPKSDQKEIRYATAAFGNVGFDDPDTVFVLRQITNSYYIKVERPGVGTLDFLFKWIDFVKAY